MSSFRRGKASLRIVFASPCPKTACAGFGGMRFHACMADPNRPRDPGKGEASPAAACAGPIPHGKRPLPATTLHASFAPAVRFGKTRKRLLPPASTRYAIRPAAEEGLGYGGFWGRGKLNARTANFSLQHNPQTLNDWRMLSRKCSLRESWEV